MEVTGRVTVEVEAASQDAAEEDLTTAQVLDALSELGVDYQVTNTTQL